MGRERAACEPRLGQARGQANSFRRFVTTIQCRQWGALIKDAGERASGSAASRGDGPSTANLTKTTRDQTPFASTTAIVNDSRDVFAMRKREWRRRLGTFNRNRPSS